MSGAIAQASSNDSTTGTGAFDICVSDKYYVPLSFSMYFKSAQSSISVNLNETSISNSSDKSYVDSLPGPVVG